jgi:3-phenylpropionate/cinnamic acid dioxygenase small subunit
MSDVEAITAVLVRYATAVDRRDWALFRSCFLDDVVADYGDAGRWDGLDGLVEFMAAAHVGFSATNHMLSNMVIRVEGDRAAATTYVHAVLSFASDESHWVDAVGTYEDELRKTAEGWRIERRTFRSTRILSS